jgi:hypothetical protein
MWHDKADSMVTPLSLHDSRKAGWQPLLTMVTAELVNVVQVGVCWL